MSLFKLESKFISLKSEEMQEKLLNEIRMINIFFPYSHK